MISQLCQNSENSIMVHLSLTLLDSWCQCCQLYPFHFLKPRYYVVVLQRFRFGQNDSTKSHFHVISRKITHKFFNYELATLQIAPYFPPKVKSWDLSYLHSRGCNCAKEQRQYRKSFTIRLWKSVLVIGRSASVFYHCITWRALGIKIMHSVEITEFFCHSDFTWNQYLSYSDDQKLLFLQF